jgi:ABC-type branched-subunit amino acid transport system ATPase component
MIQISDLSFAYGKTPVLQGVNLSVRQGEILSMIGPRELPERRRACSSFQ